MKNGTTLGNTTILSTTPQLLVKCNDCGMEHYVDSNNTAHYHNCKKEIGKNYPHFKERWNDMVNRMIDENHKDYPKYGGRGLGFDYLYLEDFAKDFLPSYLKHREEFGQSDTTIDRINGDIGYVKGNVRWATWEQNQNNKSNNVFIAAIHKKSGKAFFGRGMTRFCKFLGLQRHTCDDYLLGKGSGKGYKFIKLTKDRFNEYISRPIVKQVSEGIYAV